MKKKKLSFTYWGINIRNVDQLNKFNCIKLKTICKRIVNIITLLRMKTSFYFVIFFSNFRLYL